MADNLELSLFVYLGVPVTRVTFCCQVFVVFEFFAEMPLQLMKELFAESTRGKSFKTILQFVVFPLETSSLLSLVE